MYNKYILPEFVTEILCLLRHNGYQAYVVGGSVRDVILGKNPDDYDITTNALPENVIDICKNKYKTIETGIKHGTVTVVSQNNNIEITTYRVDGEYTDGRRPDEVIFTSNLKDDLKRRDFTINAMVLGEDGCVTDFFDGISDINKKIIRSIGCAKERFNEDALRILRALRFSSVLGFCIDEDTSKAIHSEKHLLNKVSAERIFVELKKMFMSEHDDTLKKILIEYIDVFSLVLNVNCSAEEYKKYCDDLVKIPCIDELRFIYYLCLISGVSADYLNDNLNKLKVSNTFRKKSLSINSILSSDLPAETLFDAKNLVRQYGLEHSQAAAQILYATGENTRLLKFLNEIAQNQYCVSINMLDINGNELRDLFDISGERIGKVLDALLIAVMKNEVANTKNALYEHLKTIINKC